MDDIISRSDPAPVPGEGEVSGEHPTMVAVAEGPADEAEAGEPKLLEGYQPL